MILKAIIGPSYAYPDETLEGVTPTAVEAATEPILDTGATPAGEVQVIGEDVRSPNSERGNGKKVGHEKQK